MSVRTYTMTGMETQREELDTLAAWDRWEAGEITFDALRSRILALVTATNWYSQAVWHEKRPVLRAVERLKEAEGGMALVGAWHRVRDLAERDGVRIAYRDLDDDDNLVVAP
jgi:hypothetical protein